MVRKLNEQRVIERSPGVNIRIPVEPAEMYEAGRLYGHITVAPGASLDFHIHREEMEAYYVLKGTPELMDNDETVTLNPGDALITPHDEGHSLYNNTSETVELMALIISQKQGNPGISQMQ